MFKYLDLVYIPTLSNQYHILVQSPLDFKFRLLGFTAPDGLEEYFYFDENGYCDSDPNNVLIHHVTVENYKTFKKQVPDLMLPPQLIIQLLLEYLEYVPCRYYSGDGHYETILVNWIHVQQNGYDYVCGNSSSVDSDGKMYLFPINIFTGQEIRTLQDCEQLSKQLNI